MIKRNDEPLRLNRVYLIEAIKNIERMRVSCNSYSLRINLEKLEKYLNRIKWVLDNEKADKQKESMKSMTTLDEFM